MGTPFNKAITVVSGNDAATLKKENEHLKTRIAQLEQQLEYRELGLEQYSNMHCNQIADFLIIRKYSGLAIHGKNVVVRENAKTKLHELVTAFINNYGVEEYADIYYGKINDEDIHRHPFKHSKLDVVAGMFKERGHSKCQTDAFGQWVVDRPWT